jgi:hypothetical protein
MWLRCFLLVFFSLHLGAASQALSADVNESRPATGAAVDRTNAESAVAVEVKKPSVADYGWTGAYVGVLSATAGEVPTGPPMMRPVRA